MNGVCRKDSSCISLYHLLSDNTRKILMRFTHSYFCYQDLCGLEGPILINDHRVNLRIMLITANIQHLVYSLLSLHVMVHL